MTVLNEKTRLTQRNVVVDLLAILFGIGTWIGVNSTYLQLPLLVASAPEGWTLPSYIVIIIQVANLGPILYTLLSRKTNDSYLIYGLFGIGIIAAMLMSFLYDHTVIVGDEERSIPLLAVVFLLALVRIDDNYYFDAIQYDYNNFVYFTPRLDAPAQYYSCLTWAASRACT